jgi:cytochrome c biogenesis protein CcdA
MFLTVLVFLGGMLTILSPCILPVLPFVFARAEQPFARSGLPLLVGMALTFAAVASLAAVGGSWAVHINQYGRFIALVLMTAFALTLLSRRAADWLARPFIALGNRLTQHSSNSQFSAGVSHSLLLGVATGLLWAPCAGPILGLVLTGAAISGPSARTTLLLFAYAGGAATSLAVALLAGGRVFAALKAGLGTGEWIRRSLGVAVLLAVAAIALGWDSGFLTRVSTQST